MDHRDAVFGECVDERGAFDVSCLAERLLLFQRVIIRSDRLSEIAPLARAFGVDGLIRLLNSRALAFDCDAYGIGSFNPGGAVSPFTYSLVPTKAADQAAVRARSMVSALAALPGLGKYDRIRLENAIDRATVRYPENFLHPAMADLQRDLVANIPAVREGILLAASDLVKMKIRPDDLEVRVRHQDGRFVVDNNLPLIGLESMQAHKVVEGALLAVAGTEQKLEQMRLHASTSIFREEEVRVLQAKMSFAWEQILPSAQVNRLSRVLQIGGFPDFRAAAANGDLDLSRLLDARESSECATFRQWLRSTDEVPEDMLSEQLASVRNKVAVATRGTTGKLLRWLATSGVGLLPVVGQVAGPVASLLDSFLVERVLPCSGAVAFLDNSVRSILKR